MKLEKFFDWILDKLLNYPDISLSTVKMFIDKMYRCLSEKERKRWLLKYQMISEFTLKQLSIDSINSTLKINSLEKELNEVKEK